MSRLLRVCTFAFLMLLNGAIVRAEWQGWRGDDRNGVSVDSPRLVEKLPEQGMMPVWQSEKVLSAGSGGWSSPIVWDGKVYQFAHTRIAKSQEKLGPPKYPWLAEDKRGGMNDAEYAEYEKNRRQEDIERGKKFDFREVVFCFDAATGKTLWKNEHSSVYTRFLQSGTPTIADGRLFVLGAGLNARAIDARTGKDLWQTRLPGEFIDEFMMSSFAVVDDVAAVLAGHLRGLDAATGKILWEGDAKQTRGTHSSPVVWHSPDGPRFIANVAGPETACFEPKTGRELWRVRSEANQSTPLVIGNRMLTFGSSRRAGLRCFDLSATEAKEAWKYQRVADKGSSPVVLGDYVFVQGERRLACVKLDDGREQWNTMLDLATPQYTSLVADDAKVIYTCDGVLVVAADPAEFHPLIEAKVDKQGLMASEALLRNKLKIEDVERQPDGEQKALKLWQSQVGSQGPLPCASPAVVDGKLFLRLRDRVVCYDLRAPGSLSKAP